MDRPIRKETNESPVIDAPNLLRQIDRRILLAGVGMVSFASLLLELALTRLFRSCCLDAYAPRPAKVGQDGRRLVKHAAIIGCC